MRSVEERDEMGNLDVNEESEDENEKNEDANEGNMGENQYKTHHLLMKVMIYCSIDGATADWSQACLANGSATMIISMLDSYTVTCSFFYC